MPGTVLAVRPVFTTGIVIDDDATDAWFLFHTFTLEPVSQAGKWTSDLGMAAELNLSTRV